MWPKVYGSHCVSKQHIYLYLYFILTQHITIVLCLQILISWLRLWYSFAFYSHHLLKDCLNTTLNSLDHCVLGPCRLLFSRDGAGAVIEDMPCVFLRVCISTHAWGPHAAFSYRLFLLVSINLLCDFVKIVANEL